MYAMRVPSSTGCTDFFAVPARFCNRPSRHSSGVDSQPGRAWMVGRCLRRNFSQMRRTATLAAGGLTTCHPRARAAMMRPLSGGAGRARGRGTRAQLAGSCTRAACSQRHRQGPVARAGAVSASAPGRKKRVAQDILLLARPIAIEAGSSSCASLPFRLLGSAQTASPLRSQPPLARQPRRAYIASERLGGAGGVFLADEPRDRLVESCCRLLAASRRPSACLWVATHAAAATAPIRIRVR
eukprot:363076-Chlamydomonas_euryale.AAC.5